ncbi:MAG: hypothetical protein KBT20_03520 [Bacteroidales bacterium]|nr:hypothetical protein [Candidatus Liminaster caballi]
MIYSGEKGGLQGRVCERFSIKKANPLADTTSEERENDRLVYDLYGLTEEEIKIVEGTNS